MDASPRPPSPSPDDTTYCEGQYCVFTPSSRKAHTEKTIGDILHVVQMSHIFPDSKTFVDMPLKVSKDALVEAWHGVDPDDHDAIVSFVNAHFDEPRSEVESFSKFPDHVEDPPLLDVIVDPVFRAWAKELNEFWPQLGMKTRPEVASDPERFTMIAQPNPFIVPGGRFREFYYWDSFWILKGILLCGMNETARGMVENMAHMVGRFGYIPNGARTYYLNRSQPPLFSEMLFHYWKHTGDVEFVRDTIWAVEKELEWFMDTSDSAGSHGVVLTDADGNAHILNRYNSSLSSPRPESYREDLAVATELGLDVDQHPEETSELFANIGAAAESGWDFSSRWFRDKYHMKTIHIRSLIPVDLNSFLYKAEHNMSIMYEALGEPRKSEEYAKKCAERKKAFDAFLWSQEDGQWYDYDLDARSHKKIPCSSNFFPLYAGAFSGDQAARAFEALSKSEVISRGGVVGTSLYTREQWDFPNGWPPVQWLTVEGLLNTKIPKADALAQKIALTWLYSCLGGWERSNGTAMHEKYDVRSLGWRGFGGEYEPQIGFGWSNGVAMCFMHRYGHILSHDECQRALSEDDKDYKQNKDLLRLKNVLNVTKGDIRHMMRHMGRALEQGLEREGGSSLAMLPTYVTSVPMGNESGAYLSLHFGSGRHLRVAKITLAPGERGESPVKDFVQRRYAVSDDLRSGRVEPLFDFMAGCVVDFVREHVTSEDFGGGGGGGGGGDALSLGFAFAFPIRQRGIASGHVIEWTKGYDVQGSKDVDVVELLQSQLDRHGLGEKVRCVALLNDAVGTLVSGVFFHPDHCRIGMVIGSGINLAYYEPVENIKILGGEEAPHHVAEAAEGPACVMGRGMCVTHAGKRMMIVNTEWGGFGDNSSPEMESNDHHRDVGAETHVPELLRSVYDTMLDESSTRPGHHLYEKMIGGMYLGELCRIIFVDLMDKKTIRSAETLRKPYSFPSEHMNAFCNDTSENHDEIKSILTEHYEFKSLRSEREKLHVVCDLVVLRAGRLVAAGIGAVLMRRGWLEKTTVVVDGALYERVPRFSSSIRNALSQVFGAGVRVQMELRREGTGMGAGLLAALVGNDRG